MYFLPSYNLTPNSLADNILNNAAVKNSEDSKGAHVWLGFGSLGSGYQMNVIDFKLKRELKTSGSTLEERVTV